MDKHFTPQPERFWEKYAIVPFFLAFATLAGGMGYLVTKETKNEMDCYKQEYAEQRQIDIKKNSR